MHLSRGTRWALRIGTGLTLAFLYAPLLVIAVYAFNDRRTATWPPPGFTLDWFDKAFHNHGVRDALWTSIQAGLGATAIAMVLGTLAAFAVSRYRFFGRETISFLVILPIALPGIVTGMAFTTTFTQVLGIDLSLFTIIVGHATFCIVVVYNNVVARLRRTSASFEEASADLGAHSWQTFRFVTFPQLRSALVAGGAAGLRAELRRGDRDDVHRRRPRDAADLDPHEPLAAQPAAGRQRRRRRRDPAVDHPGLHRDAHHRRPGRRAHHRGRAGAVSGR